MHNHDFWVKTMLPWPPLSSLSRCVPAPSDSKQTPGFRSLCLPPLGDFTCICLMGTHFWGRLLPVVIVDFTFAFDFPAFLPLLSFLFLMVPYVFHKWVVLFSNCSFLKAPELYVNFIYSATRWGHWIPQTWCSSTSRLPVDLELDQRPQSWAAAGTWQLLWGGTEQAPLHSGFRGPPATTSNLFLARGASCSNRLSTEECGAMARCRRESEVWALPLLPLS